MTASRQIRWGFMVARRLLAGDAGEGAPVSRGVTRRTALTGGLALTALGALSACTESGAGLGLGAGTLKIQAGDDEIPGLRRIAEGFTQQTGVNVEYIQREINADSISDFIAQAPMGQAPDIIISPHDNLGQLASNGVIAPVELGDRAQDFTDNARTATRYDGVSYGVPYAVECVALIRNDEITREQPETFDDLRRIGRALMEQEGLAYPLAVSQSPTSGDPYHLYPIQTSFGAEVFRRTEDGEYTPDLAMGGRQGEAFATYLAELGAAGDVQTSMTPDVATEAFLGADTAFLIGGPWELAEIEAAGMDCTVLPVPPAGDHEARPFAGVQALFVNAHAANPVAAQDFVTNWVTTTTAQTALYQSTGRPPASLSAVEAMEGDPMRTEYARIAAEFAVPMPSIPAMGAVWNFWGISENAILDGRAEPIPQWESMIENIEGQI